MNPFLVKLIFEISIRDHAGPSQFDEQLRWLEAEDETSAWTRADSIARQEEEQFVNQDGQLVVWKFIGITGLYQLGEMKDGNQIFALTHETQDARSFLSGAAQSARLVQERMTIPA